MPVIVTRTEVLDPVIRERILAMTDRRTGAFWQRHLSGALSKYTFDQALAGRPSTSVTVDAILAAYDAEVARLKALLEGDWEV